MRLLHHPMKPYRTYSFEAHNFVRGALFAFTIEPLDSWSKLTSGLLVSLSKLQKIILG